MKLVGAICRHETIYQIIVQGLTELRPNSLNCTQIADDKICNKP